MHKPGFKFGSNPIVIKELRSRMRGPRAFIILTAFLVLLGLFTYGLYRIVTFGQNYGGGAPLGAVVGRSVFTGLAFLELILVCLITPALTAGAVSGEEEHRTLDMLLATPLRPASVLWGKLISALTYVFLLILAGVPMASIIFILGGVTATDMIQALGILVLCAITFGTLGLFFSVWFRRTGRAMVASYAVLLLLAFGGYFLYIFVGVVQRSEPARMLLVANPIAAMAAAIAGDVQPNVFGSVMGGLTPLLWALSGRISNVVMGTAPGGGQAILRPLWHYTAGIYVVSALALYLAGVQMLKPIRRWRMGKPGVIGLATLVLVLGGAAYAFYGPATYATLGYPSLGTPTPTPVLLQMTAARVVSVPAVAAPVPASTSGVATAPVPTPTAVPPGGLPPGDAEAIYSSAILRVLADAPEKPHDVILVDTASVGLLTDPKVDGSEPSPLGEELLGALTARVQEAAPVAVTTLPGKDVGSKQGMAGGTVVVAVGRVRYIDENHITLPVYRCYATDDCAVRRYTLVRNNGGWQIVDDGDPLAAE